MPDRSDTSVRLPGSRLCEISGVNRQTRDKWARDGLLRKGDDYDQLDLVELVILKLLLETLRKKEAKLAWAGIRPHLRNLMPGPQLTLVWDPQRRAAKLALTDEEIVPLVRHGRPVQVLDLGTAVDDARAAFRREVEALAVQAEARRRAQQSAADARQTS